MAVRGGHKLQAAIRKALNSQGVRSVKVGFFKDSKYPDGTPVAAVAAWNEFGTKRIPERPFFRQALAKVKPDVSQLIKERIDSRTMRVGDNLAGEIGAMVQGAIQQRIVDLKEPPNAPSTLKAKSPKTNPLINEGILRGSVAWKVEKL